MGGPDKPGHDDEGQSQRGLVLLENNMNGPGGPVHFLLMT
jgi:hypothetical protein